MFVKICDRRTYSTRTQPQKRQFNVWEEIAIANDTVQHKNIIKSMAYRPDKIKERADYKIRCLTFVVCLCLCACLLCVPLCTFYAAIEIFRWTKLIINDCLCKLLVHAGTTNWRSCGRRLSERWTQQDSSSCRQLLDFLTQMHGKEYFRYDAAGTDYYTNYF